jgi:hypothetical protein
LGDVGEGYIIRFTKLCPHVRPTLGVGAFPRSSQCRPLDRPRRDGSRRNNLAGWHADCLGVGGKRTVWQGEFRWLAGWLNARRSYGLCCDRAPFSIPYLITLFNPRPPNFHVFRTPAPSAVPQPCVDRPGVRSGRSRGLFPSGSLCRPPKSTALFQKLLNFHVFRAPAPPAAPQPCDRPGVRPGRSRVFLELPVPAPQPAPAA